MPFFGVPIRNGLPIGLGSSAGFGVQPFDPSYLFSAGEQGFLYDPSDLSTLFTDSAGTTPVTGVEQVVGLMLDKSKGLVLGSQQDPGLANYVQVLSGTWVASGANYVFTDTVGGQSRPGVQWPTQSLAAGWYQISVVVASITGATQIRMDGVGATDRLLIVGTNTFFANVTALSRPRFRIEDLSTTIGDGFVLTSVSVRELPGNHATSTGAARPTLSARVNLLLATEDLTTANWTPTGVTSRTASASTATLPTGQNVSLTRVVEDSGNTAHRVASSPTISVISGTTHTASVLIKGGGVRDWLYLRVEDAASNFLWFNATTGATGTVSAGLSNVSVVSLGNGAWLASCTRVVSGSNLQMLIGHAAADNTAVYTGDGSAWFEAGGADLRATNDGVGIPAYQRVNTATDYDSSGFPLYLSFGGTQAMTINSSANNTFQNVGGGAIWGGFRASGTDQTIVLFSTNTSNTNSRAALFSQITAARREDAQLSATVATNSSFAANTNYVGTGVFNWSGGAITLRTNGVVSQTSSLPSSGLTSNTTSAALTIGSLAGLSNYLTGRIYSLIGVGSAVSAGNISATESWVNGKTKAY